MIVKVPSREEAEEAVRVIIRWLGDSPDREGLQETPRRVLDSYKRSCDGYSFRASLDEFALIPNDGNCSDMIIVKEIGFSSNCEHHLSPVIGKAHVSYVPRDSLMGIGSIIKVVDGFARRLQLQERLATQIALFLEKVLNPLGVAVLLEAEHLCVSCYRHTTGEGGLRVQTSHMLGVFKENDKLCNELFLRLKL
ncbi:MAG: GTP cyclohydrolase I [Aaplasma endosymbiont of Hyalomma asiaticum]